MTDLTSIHDLITFRATESLETARDWIRVPSFSDTDVSRARETPKFCYRREDTNTVMIVSSRIIA